MSFIVNEENVVGELPEMGEILRHSTQVKNIWVPYGG